MLTSVETTLVDTFTGAGVQKRVPVPVLVILGPSLEGRALSCTNLMTFAGLIAGPYLLTDGRTVSVPAEFVGDDPQYRHDVTLEVLDE